MTVPANHSGKNVPADVRIVEISGESVGLYKILKFEGMVASEVSPPKTKAEPAAKKQAIEKTSGNSVAVDVEKK